MRLYVDGRRAADDVAIEHRLVDRYPRLIVGGSAGAHRDPEFKVGAFRGAVDGLAVFDRVLVDEEIAALYAAREVTP